MIFKRFLKNKNSIEPLPYIYYFIVVAIIALIGFFDSIYLAVSHYRNYTDLGYQSFCAISQTFNCDTVSQSPYSILFGVPLAIWGILGYGFFIFLLGFTWHPNIEKKRIWTLLMVLASGFSVYSIYLAYISAYKIHSHCIMCILSYAVSFALFFYALLIRNRFGCEAFFNALVLDIRYLLRLPLLSIPAASAFAGTALVLMIAFPAYWEMKLPEINKDITTGITKDGHPWIGAENPELTIVEFSDYRCFQCKKMHYYLRRIIETNPDKIRLVHRHFPMDHVINPIVKEPFHKGSAQLAIISLHALEKGKFWEMNDLLFDLPKGQVTIKLKDLARKTDLDLGAIAYALQDRELWEKLHNDILEALNFELTGTPGFVINNKMYPAQIPPDILRPYIK